MNEKIYTHGFTIGQWDVIVAGLAELPYKVGADLIHTIQGTVGMQYRKDNAPEQAQEEVQLQG